MTNTNTNASTVKLTKSQYDQLLKAVANTHQPSPGAFEHKCILLKAGPNIADSIQEELNTLSQEGYELVEIFPVGHSSSNKNFIMVTKKLIPGD